MSISTWRYHKNSLFYKLNKWLKKPDFGICRLSESLSPGSPTVHVTPVTIRTTPNSTSVNPGARAKQR